MALEYSSVKKDTTFNSKEEEESILQSVPLPLFSNKSFLNIDHSRYQDWQSKTDSDPSSDITAYSYLPKEALCLSQF
jgi:hypothetical protein